MLRKQLFGLMFIPAFLFAQDQAMEVYSSGGYGNRPLIYISHLTEAEVGDIILLVAAVTKTRIVSIDLEPPLLSENRLRVTTCSGYFMVNESRTCEGGQHYALQKNLSGEWEMVPEPPIAWRY